MRRLINVFGILALVAVVLYHYVPRPSVRVSTRDEIQISELVTIDGHSFTVEVANTLDKRTRGLSGRAKLEENTGMLFVFDKPSTACFWMKDMSFPLDILWFDAEGKLYYEQKNITPDTYPREFCPLTPASQVLEVSAGTIDRLQIPLGAELKSSSILTD